MKLGELIDHLTRGLRAILRAPEPNPRPEPEPRPQHKLLLGVRVDR